MKEKHTYISIDTLCKWFDISRQAYYQHEWKESETVFQYEVILEEIRNIRKHHNRIGVRKLQTMLQPFIQVNGIKIGRDALFNLLSVHGLLVRKRKRHIQTTYSHHWLKKYPNLIIDFIPSKPNQLWVSDITYWKLEDS